MYKIRDYIREEFKNEELYLRALKRLTEMLMMEDQIDIYCAHEAGHATYFIQSGAKETDIGYQGPTIFFDTEAGTVAFFPCAAYRVNPPAIKNIDDLRSVARIGVAGGIVEKVLENSTDLGDADDRQKFKRAYRDAIANEILPDQSEEDMWLSAKEEVSRDLSGESSRISARNLATKIKHECFQLDPEL